MQTRNTQILTAVSYFVFSILLTGLFIIIKFGLYNNTNEMFLSGSIAGAKWLIQIIAGYILLKEKKWEFIKRIGFVCFIGSCVLFSYYLISYLPFPISEFSQFVVAISLSVVTMIILYYLAVKKMNISILWFWAWIFFLLIAITLQLTLFFK